MKLVQKMWQLVALVDWLGNNFFFGSMLSATHYLEVSWLGWGGGVAAKWLEGKHLVEDPVHDILNAKLRFYFIYLF